MVQLVVAALVALVLLGIFGQASDGVLKKSIGVILLWFAAGAIVIPLAFWLLVNFGAFLLVVLLLFILFRWLFSSSVQVH